jgi:Xaa-Pro aminopeptidase
MTRLAAPPVPAHLPVVPADELAARARALGQRLAEAGLDGALLLHPSSHFWISGTLGDGWPLIDADGRAVLAIRMSAERAARESALPQAPVTRLSEVPDALASLGAPVRGAIGVEMDVVPAGIVERLQRTFPGAEFRDVSRIVREVRAVKSPWEIGWIEKAAVTVCEPMDEVMPQRIRIGRAEIDVMAEFEAAMRVRRHQGVIPVRRWNLAMHYGTISSGASACYPCYFDGPDGLEGLYPAAQQGGGERLIEANVAVLVDAVGAAGGYLADRTRIFCIGTPPPEMVAAHDFCRTMLGEIVDRLRPGAIPSAIYDDVAAIAAGSAWADRFMGWGENQVRFLGHGIGIDLDEFPVLAPRFDAPLVPGNVLAVEPKVFLGDLGGVGVENTYVVTEDGARNLTPGPEEIRVLPEVPS